MASDKSAILDLEIDTSADPLAQLQFQDFSPSYPLESGGHEQTHTFTSFPDSPVDEETGQGSGKTGSPSFLSFDYYQQFFDVETSQVYQRLLWSMIPWPKTNYLKYHIRPKPDLYGPFWVCVTLVFAIAMSGNVANYLQSESYEWRYNFRQVSIATTTVFLYAWFVPVILWLLLWWRKSQQPKSEFDSGMDTVDTMSFLEILCIYGYSLTIYVPVSLLWLIQISWIQWILVLIATVCSGFVLLTSLWPVVAKDERKLAIAIIIGVLFMHLLLATGFMLYFYHVPNHSPSSVVPSSIQPVPLTTTTKTSDVKKDTVKSEIVAKESIKPSSDSQVKLPITKKSAKLYTLENKESHPVNVSGSKSDSAIINALKPHQL